MDDIDIETAPVESDQVSEPQSRQAELHWDDRGMATSHANAINIQSTREQVDLFFGTNTTWNVAAAQTVTVALSNRVILSPFAAKRLSLALNSVIATYEDRYGPLDPAG